MGSYYTLGIITSFTAKSKNLTSLEEWKQKLNSRIDTDLFEMTIFESSISANLKPDIFQEYIIDFYRILKEITSPIYSRNIENYEQEFGNNLEEYQFDRTTLYVGEDSDKGIEIDVEYALLFIEGKVIVEEFYTEPQMVNWLFRNSNIPNKLAGCVISSIT
jgi:hypothetical protein